MRRIPINAAMHLPRSESETACFKRSFIRPPSRIFRTSYYPRLGSLDFLASLGFKSALRCESYNRCMSGKKRNPSVETSASDQNSGDPGAAGQSGDVQGLSSLAEADSESVEELAEEGQAFEAEAIDAVENAPDADEGEVKTREVSEDDVPEEYLNQD